MVTLMDSANEREEGESRYKLPAPGVSEGARSQSMLHNLYVLWTVHLSIILGNDELDTQLLYFTISLL